MKTLIKFCGLRRKEDMEIVSEVKPDFAGFILTDRFWRFTEPSGVRELIRDLPEKIKTVGVMVDEPFDTALRKSEESNVSMLQLHGSEDNEYIRQLREKTGKKIIKAFKVTKEEDIINAVMSEADLILLDSGTGTGKTFDWSLLKNIERPFILAGGLSPENVKQAVKTIHPYGVDVSSGIETDKLKDRKKAMLLTQRVREAEQEEI